MIYKKNGFTLIELLSIIVILGVLVTIAVTSYNAYIKNANETYYVNLSDIFKSAVIEYYSDTPGQLPSNIGDYEKVKSDLLLNKNYLESLIDTDKNNCEGEGIVQKKATGKYEYTTCLRCPSYNNNEWYGDGCKVSEDENATNRGYEIISDGPDTYNQGKDANGNFGDTIITVPNAILKGDTIELNKTLPPNPPKIDTKVPHNTVYKVYYQYQNEYIEKKITVIDDTKPTFELIAKYKSTNANYPEATWTKDDVVVTITANDWTIQNELMGAGIDKIQISRDEGTTWEDLEFTDNNNVVTASTTITKDGDITYHFRGVDKAGNISEATYKIYIDKEDPKFENGYPTVVTSISGYNSTTPIVTLNATDNLEVTEMCVSTTSYDDCAWETYKDTINWEALSKHLDGTKKTYYISVKDIAGNIAKTTKNYTVTTAGIACGNYAKKASVSFAGLSWYALSDNGDTTTLMLKTNSHNTQAYGTSTEWSNSNAKSKVTAWFNSNSKLTLEKTTGYAINDTTYGIVRIPTYNEGVGVANDSNTPYWTLTASGTNMWYVTNKGGTTYATYSKTQEDTFKCYYGYRENSIDALKKYDENIHNTGTSSTTAPPSSTSNYIDWSYQEHKNDCGNYVTDSSGKGPNTGHYGYGPFENEGPFCADIAPYYGDCGVGTNFCPASDGSPANCNNHYTTYSIYKNAGGMGLRPVVIAKERCN